MRGTIVVVLIGIWALGVLFSYTFSGMLHLLLVIAAAVLLVRLIKGERPLTL